MVESQKIKICHLTSVHPYNDPRIFFKECQSLTKVYKVYLIAPVQKDFSENGVQILGVGKPKNRFVRLFWTDLKVFFKALQTRSQIFHIHDPELLLLVPWLRLFGKKVIYDIHEDYITSIKTKKYLPKWSRSFVAAIFSGFEKCSAYFCKLIIAEKYYKDRFPNAVSVLNYPLIEHCESEDFTKENSIDLNPKYNWYFYSGNITIDRGALEHIKILEADPDSAVFMIGKCSKETFEKINKKLEEKNIANDRLIVIGVGQYVPKKWINYATKMHNWVAGLALFPDNPHYYRKELTKFFEYMSNQIPMLVSDFPAWENFVSEWQCGYSIDLNSLQDFREKMKLLQKNVNKESLEKNQNAFDWRTEEKKLFKVYESI